MRTLNSLCPNFMDHLSFANFVQQEFLILSDLRLKGVGSQSKVTDTFTKALEHSLLTPEMVCYMLCETLSFTWGEEHR